MPSSHFHTLFSISVSVWLNLYGPSCTCPNNFENISTKPYGYRVSYCLFFLFFRDEMRNAFNLLLISLLGFDSWFLFGCILENFRRNFGLASNLHILLFPYFLYPTVMVAMSGSIFMTVAISLERYFAVHHPIGKVTLPLIKNPLICCLLFLESALDPRSNYGWAPVTRFSPKPKEFANL